MSNSHVPTNTHPGGVPSTPSPDSLAIDLTERPAASNELTDKAREKAQARKSEGFHTSEKLERIDQELTELEEQREKAENDLNAASVEYANGTEGAQETVSQLRDKLKDCEDKTDALQRARQVEQDRLGEAYRDKLARAQQKRRDQIEEQTGKIAKSMEKLEKDAEKLAQSLAETNQNLQEMLPLVRSTGAGRRISSIRDVIRESLSVRLGIKDSNIGPGPGGPGTPSLKQAAPRAKPFLEMAEIPDYLTDLPDPDAD